MKKITRLLFATMLLFAMSTVDAQNLIPDWDALGRIGLGTEANKWGFAASTGGTDWGTANGGGVRYRDVTNVSIDNGGTFTGREFLYRWEGSYIGSTMSLGLPTHAGVETGQIGISLEAGKAYSFSGYYEWINNAGSPTYEFSISDAPVGGNILVTKSYSTSTKTRYYPFDIYFEVPSHGDYYIQLKQTNGISGSQGGLIGLAELNLEETAIVIPPTPYLARGVKTFTTDGTWCWFQDPRALYHKGIKEQTYTGWITSDGKIQVASYNHATGEIIQTTVKDDFQIDDHNNPTFLVRDDGRIMVSYSGHFFGPMRVIVSENPEDITSFGAEATFGTSVTYANPYQIGSDIYMFYRDGSSWHPSIAISNDGGLSWGAPQTLIKRDAAQKRPYVRYTQDSQEGVHITFTTGHPRQEASNKIYYVYFKDNKFYKADGTFIKDYTGTASALDIDAGEPEIVYNASSGKGWTWDIALDENENPVILYAAFPDDYNHHYYYAKFDGSQWNNHHIVNSGKWFPQTPSGGSEPEPNYSGGMSLDPNDVSTVYLSKQVNDVFEIYKYQTPDEGASWNTTAITENTPADIVNVRPVVPRNHQPGLFDVMWMRGKYITYQNYHTSIMYYSPNDELKYYDFGTQNSALDANAIRVTNTSMDNTNFGFEDVSGLLSVDDSQTNNAETDYVSGTSSAIFKAKLFNGTYEVTVVQGTNTVALSGQTIKANGVEVVSSGTSNMGEWKTYTFDVDISNGILNLEISNSNGNGNLWVINSLLIDTKELIVNGLNILEENVLLYEVDDTQLHYSTSPVEANPEDITWYSDDDTIATVDANGLVTAKSTGSTTMYASMYNGNLVDSCIINVNAIVPLANKVTFDFGTLTSPVMADAIRIDETTQLNESYGWVDTSSILSRDRGSSITNPDLDFVLASVDKEFQVFLENGIYHITTTHGDSQFSHDKMNLFANGANVATDFSSTLGNYITNEFDVTVENQKLVIKIGDNGGSDVNWVWNTLKIDKTSLRILDDKLETTLGIKTYPNPVKDILYLDTHIKISSLKIYNILGNMVLAKAGVIENGMNSINVSELSSGLYIMHIVSAENNKSQVFKFFK
ncbi:BNR-4 repeat-containing protein [Mariniflexile litorale]|uniref:BNR-4 repeat-containing protein n=1 Tax=Mariniflexile litorale TaxID=3045158 RepID=A0AAU7EFJ7_9FLAO|nr:BNR-4 repeat-containing protein [Mariniflexile sp. KMM 9835]MDQ8210698.1 BNR-4 repeat-containing protein [Mariniflexile sp. KMM 9835]